MTLSRQMIKSIIKQESCRNMRKLLQLSDKRTFKHILILDRVTSAQTRMTASIKANLKKSDGMENEPQHF